LGPEPDSDIAGHDLEILADGEMPPGALLLRALSVEIDEQRAAQRAAANFLRQGQLAGVFLQRSAARVASPFVQPER
jgi:hypothetical protein